MKISPFFHDLRSAYQAEIDDLTQDSEGKDVLRKRLAQKRSEIGFLVKMMELAPEMVAVVFHQGFRFTRAAPLEQALAVQDRITQLDGDSMKQVILRHAHYLSPLGDYTLDSYGDSLRPAHLSRVYSGVFELIR